MKHLLLLIVALGALGCKGQITTIDTSIHYPYIQINRNLPDTVKYTDTVTAKIIYMINDSSVRIITTRVSQCEYWTTGNYNNYGWSTPYIQRDIKWLSVDADKIIKVISLNFPEHLRYPKYY